MDNCQDQDVAKALQRCPSGSVMRAFFKSKNFGFFGTIFGLVALGLAVFPFIWPQSAQQTSADDAGAGKVVAEKVVKLNDWLTVTTQRTESLPLGDDQAAESIEFVEKSVFILAFLAIVCGALGFISREDWRASAVAATLGGTVIAFQVFVTLAYILLFILVLAIIWATLNAG